MGRPVLAFLIAPLWVPLIFAPYAALKLFPYAAQWHWVVISTIISVLFAYAGTLLLGLPAFLVLKRRKLISVWAGIGFGFLGGAVTWQIFLAAFALSLGSKPMLAFDLWAVGIAGPVGALVGLTIWLIGRPRSQNS